MRTLVSSSLSRFHNLLILDGAILPPLYTVVPTCQLPNQTQMAMIFWRLSNQKCYLQLPKPEGTLAREWTNLLMASAMIKPLHLIFFEDLQSFTNSNSFILRKLAPQNTIQFHKLGEIFYCPLFLSSNNLI